MSSCKRLLISICFFLTACSFLFHRDASMDGILRGLNLCMRSILPSLFPFFVLTNLWIGIAPPNCNCKIFSRLFHQPAPVFTAWLFGALAGYPIGAKTVVQLYETGQITQEDANHALQFCCNAGPAFSIGILGQGIFQSSVAGVMLYGIHVTSSILLGILLRPNRNVNHTNRSQPSMYATFSETFVSSCRAAISTTLMVCGFLLFFSILTIHIQLHLPMQSNRFQPFLAGFLELTNGALSISESGISAQQMFLILSAMLGWGGLCVHAQTLSLMPAELSVRHYLLGKALHSLVSLALACLLLRFHLTLMLAGVPLLFLWAKSSSGKTTINQI